METVMVYARTLCSALMVVLTVLLSVQGKGYAELRSSPPGASLERSENEADTPSTTPTDDAAQTGTEHEDERLFYGYWKQGLYLEHPNKRFTIKIGGKIMGDAGYLESGPEIQAAFPDFDGLTADFRSLSVAFSGNFWKERLEFKLEVDFANVQDIQDEWIRFPTIPVLKYMTFGHLKEPFSLENLSSLNYLTFMERGLPNEPFAPGRNIGILVSHADERVERRITWAFGGFLNTGSLSDVGDARDQIEQANGYDISARVTGLPWYRNKGANVLHLGVSYSYWNREEAGGDSEEQFRARPESRLTDDRLIDTDTIPVRDVHILNPEIAIVAGPFSLQGEVFSAQANGDERYRFWGTYLYGSVFLTGEHRLYNPSKGIFSQPELKQPFRPRQGRWGALELGARYAYVDLNDHTIEGGKEHNLTLGVTGYIRSNMRVMLNYIHVRVEDRATPPIEDDTAHILQTRLQIYF